MRATITGAGGTGVREIAREVSRLFGLTLIESPVRKVLAERGIHTEAEQAQVAADKLVEAERTIFNAAEEGFSLARDAVQVHSLLDHLAYRLMRTRHGLTDTELTDLEHRTLNSMASADIVVFCPAGVVEVEADGVRLRSNVDRITVDAIIRGYIRRFAGQVTVLDLLVPSFRGRVQHVASSMSQLGFDATLGGTRALGNAHKEPNVTVKRLDEGKRVLTSGTFRYEVMEGFYPSRVWVVPNRAEAPSQLIFEAPSPADFEGGVLVPEAEVFADGKIELSSLELDHGQEEHLPYVVQVELRKADTSN